MALQSSSRLQQDEATRQAAPITASPSGGEGSGGDDTTHFVSPTEPTDMDDGDIWLKVPSQ